MKSGGEPRVDKGKAPLTLHMQLGPPAVPLDEDGGAQEGGPTQSPDEGAEHERELQGPELGQEGGWPAPAEAVRDLQGDKKRKVRSMSHGEGSPELQKNKEVRDQQRGVVWRTRESPVASLWNMQRQNAACLADSPR